MMSNKLISPAGKVIPFDTDKWNFVGAVVLENTDFHNGIIDFDIAY